MRRVLVALFLLSGALASCRTFDFQRQQVFLRYEPQKDVLDLVVAYEGVGSESEDPKEAVKTTETLTRASSGHRHVLFWDWPFDFDFDEMIAEIDRSNATALQFLAIEKNIELTEHRFFLD